LANTPPTIDSIAAGPGQAVVTFTPGLANESSPITGYRYVKDDNTVISIPSAENLSPTAIAVDAAGNVYTANYSAGFAGGFVAKATPDGTLSYPGDIPSGFYANCAWYPDSSDRPVDVRNCLTPDGVYAGGQLTGIALDAAGNVYVVSSYFLCYFSINECVNRDGAVWKITPDGKATVLGIINGNGPLGIAVDAAGNVYTANYDSNNVSKIIPNINDDVLGISTILGETGSGPSAIAVDAAGNVYTANRNSNNVSKITPNGASSILGTTGEGPRAIALDAVGNVYTANALANNMSKITPDGFSTTSETSLTIGGSEPRGIALDAAGNVYMPNFLSNNLTKITPDGTVTILTEIPSNQQAKPVGIAIDKAGNIYTANISVGQSVNGDGPFVCGEVCDTPRPGGITKTVDSSIVTYPATGDTSPIRITGLTPRVPGGFGTEYLISLIAVSDAGESGMSNRVLVTPTAPIAPDAPTIDSIRPGAGQLTVAFTPGYDNGSPITSYTASCLRVVGSGRVRINVVGSTSPIAVTSMYNGDTYECFVTATNIFGTGPASATSEPFVVGPPDIDDDGDGWADVDDNCPLVANPQQEDADGDNVGNVCDNCLITPNTDQLDADENGVGDLCTALGC
jgi:streptogramin lyase